MDTIVPMEVVKSRIYLIRGQKVLLDSDLAELYGVETKRLNEQVRRNLARFPADFMFQLNDQEVTGLRSQIATSSLSHGGRRYAPCVFTEQGVAMLSAIRQMIMPEQKKGRKIGFEPDKGSIVTV